MNEQLTTKQNKSIEALLLTNTIDRAAKRANVSEASISLDETGKLPDCPMKQESFQTALRKARSRGDIDEIGPFGLDHRRRVAIGAQPKVGRNRFSLVSVDIAGSDDLRTAHALPRLHLNAAEKTAANGNASKGPHLSPVDSKSCRPGGIGMFQGVRSRPIAAGVRGWISTRRYQSLCCLQRQAPHSALVQAP